MDAIAPIQAEFSAAEACLFGNKRDLAHRRGRPPPGTCVAALALVSGALFGLSRPAAKVLLGDIDPSILAGLLYCGAGLGVAVLRRAGLGRLLGRSQAAEVPLKRRMCPALPVLSPRAASSGLCSSWLA
jgi:hypothetical protein